VHHVQPVRFGDSPEQVGDLLVPAGPGPHPAIVLWHGGGYAPHYGRDMLAPAAADLCARGFATLNATYRRLGSGGGWPQTFDDARAALDALGSVGADIDLGDVTALGFSAGAPLALRATRHPGAVRPRRVINLAGVSTVEAAARAGGATSSLFRLLGDPGAAAGAYAGADPAGDLPLGVPSLHVHGTDDELVPLAVTEAFVAAARTAGDGDAELVVLPGAGHFDVHRPGTDAWSAVLAWLAR
jgi:acetyl esterase/lipase